MAREKVPWLNAPDEKRCTAKSKQTQQRCKQWREPGSTKCRFHGGRSTGARTAKGRQRQAQAVLKHGQDSLPVMRKDLLKTILRLNRRIGATVETADMLAVKNSIDVLTGQQLKDLRKALNSRLRQLRTDPERDHRRRLLKLYLIAYETRNGRKPSAEVADQFWLRVQEMTTDEQNDLRMRLHTEYIKALAENKRTGVVVG